MAGLRTIIALAFVLAIGFLLVILSCALYYNWWPLLVVATYILAPLPNALCGRCAGEDDLMSDYNGGALDAGHFITGMFIVTGFFPAMIMSISGGILVYGTIIAYTHFFAHQGDDF
ncbi:vacuolar protein sorting 55 [Mucor mucedo]|uniref:vacuolar protein sorting 55 n=1 Tax=Mucor mucedo TaxID=29922 RepID=UPI0022206CD1|nr:vacuolar protein sorting 55 [Mucor mucedo]KAI7888688.1 vacuolar protein sorting 55 [Mucor mucedo]